MDDARENSGLRKLARDSRVRHALLAAAAACFAACGDGGDIDDTLPSDGAQGSANSSLVRVDAGVLVDPAGRYAWVRHEQALYAVSTTGAAVSLVMPFTGAYDVRLAFVTTNDALLIAIEPDGCPFATNACTRVAHVDTVTATITSSIWEGSTLDYSVQSASKRLVAMTGGWESNGVYVADAVDGELELLFWEGLSGGVGWSGCEPGECDERLWMVARDGMRSWRLNGGVLAAAPDITMDGDCNATYQLYTPEGSYRPAGLVATSASGRYVALTCGRTFGIYDTHEHRYSDTFYNGPVSFSGENLVGHFNTEEDDDYDYWNPGNACIEMIDPSVPYATSSFCLPDSSGVTYYAPASGAWIVASGFDGLWVFYVDGSNYYDEPSLVPGYSLVDGAFVERVANYEIWFLQEGELHALFAYGPTVVEAGLPVPVSDLNILPSQDELALLTNDAVVFYSVVTGSAQAVALP